MRWVFGLVVACACGRLDFDPTRGGTGSAGCECLPCGFVLRRHVPGTVS
ncbi:MAG TPA: hypothetical protein VGF94_16900 [Kofleriaceae bacterium]